MQLVALLVGTTARLTVTPASLSRAQRAHSRLSWAERLARNARPLTAGRVAIKLCGVPQAFATRLGLTVGQGNTITQRLRARRNWLLLSLFLHDLLTAIHTVVAN